jgi:hypothetical protein
MLHPIQGPKDKLFHTQSTYYFSYIKCSALSRLDSSATTSAKN